MTRILHNPRCTKSRQAVKLLQDRGIDFQEVRYLDEPPTPEELGEIVRLLGVSAADIVRRKEALFKELKLADRDLSEQEWLEVLSENPRLIERPIVIHNCKAAIGRPTENIEAIL
ncbi:MAG TPA: arsenate reductase (glutaredoxin) [Planctomycetaceae bacterium]|nr:arsenate reductase (glutaredoxin) [Planctomycetaceae bacterium]